MNITRLLFLGFTFFFTINLLAQNAVNDYKYIMVPEGYVFLKENDSYQLNSLTKFLFKKYGFTAFKQGDELPDDLKMNGCKALRADVQKKSGLLKTKLIVTLQNCNGNVVFSSKEGESRKKDFKASYHEALRNAFKDVEKLKYKYNTQKEILSQNESLPVKSSTILPPSKAAEKSQVSTAVENTPLQTTSKTSVKTATYVFNDGLYVFEKKEYGFEIQQRINDTSTSIGKIFISNRDNTYIVKAGDLSGNGYFDGYGNFILERINPATNKLITDTFARQ